MAVWWIISFFFLYMGLEERDSEVIFTVPLIFIGTFWVKEVVNFLFGKKSIYDGDNF